MHARWLGKRVRRALGSFPAVLISGPRQSGKTWLARSVFAHLPYVNFESPIERAEFESDPIGFLAKYPEGAVLDEVQLVPSLLQFLQVRIDEDRQMGRWCLTGSQQPELVGQTTESLAGRVMHLELYPIAVGELGDSVRRPRTLHAAVLQGGLAPIYDEDRDVHISDWLESYLAGQVNQDLRTHVTPRSTAQFDKFLRHCAVQTAQEVNRSSIGSDIGATHDTVDAWLDALEACYLVQRVQPYWRNFRKRLVKRPKLHFVDTGIACRLLRIRDVEQLSQSPQFGALFESWCYGEIIKSIAGHGLGIDIYYWRSSDGLEVDFVLEMGGTLIPLEVKVGATPSSDRAPGVQRLRKIIAERGDSAPGKGLVVYGGDDVVERAEMTFVPWHSIDEALCDLQ